MRALVERIPYLGCFLFAGAFLWQASALEDWGIFGPGPGLFPQVVTGVACLVAAVLLVKPSLARARDGKDDEHEAPLAAAERRVFLYYGAALFLLVIGAAWLGLLLTSVLLAVLLTGMAERRGLYKAVLFGLVCGLFGVIVLGRYMDVVIPETAIEKTINRQFR